VLHTVEAHNSQSKGREQFQVERHMLSSPNDSMQR